MSASLVQQLKELGIAEKTARFALSKNNNDVERAANYVFSGNAARDEVRDSPIPNPTSTSPRPNLDPVPEDGPSVTSTPATSHANLSDDDNGDDSDTSVESPVSEKKWGGGFRKSIKNKFRSKRGTSASASSSTVDVMGLGIDRGDDGRGRSQESLQSRGERDNAIISRREKRKNSLTTTLPPPASTPLPASQPPTPDESQPQASSLILGAMNQQGSGGKERKGASGAIGMLGLKAAAAVTSAAGTVSPRAGGEASPAVISSQPVGSSKAAKQSKSRRAASPFFRARRSRDEARKRDKSPEIGALEKEKDESDGESIVSGRRGRFRPQASAYEDDDDADDSDSDRDVGAEEDDDTDPNNTPLDEHEGDDAFFDDGEDVFDDETEANTLANAMFFEGDAGGLGGASYDDGRLDNYGEEIEQDILGEGPNVVVPPQPLFQQSMFQAAKKETTKSGLQLETSRPVYARDRCTIVLTHGEPDLALEESGKRLRRYVVLSDLSEESRYAVEWAVGTVARDGDEVFLISVKEDEHRVDPKQWSNSDRHLKLRVQKERQTTCLLLTKQVTGLLQRTRLNITVTCQFLHAKNSRHMLLDLIDFLEPTMVIVGSRGLGKLKGILLGSTSHYLVQKSSVPIMVARRRLQRPLRKTNPANLRHAPRVSLASASIEKQASSKQEDDVVDLEEQEKAEMAEAKRASTSQGSEKTSA